MSNFVPQKKQSKKAQKKAAKQRRVTWGFSPVSRKVESKKHYNRKRFEEPDADE